VTAASLDNTGRIYLIGSSANQALFDVASSAGFGAAGVLSGYVRLAGDSGIEFTSGQITSLAASAHLGLNGHHAFIEDSTALGSNSALTGLASIGLGAYFELENKAVVSTTGALANDGSVYLDANAGDGGSNLTVVGALTNSQELGIGNGALSASDEVTAASFDNTGKIQLTGSSANQALLDVTGSAGFGAAGVLSGYVRLAGDSAIEFLGGEIDTIGAASQLTLDGNTAFVEDSGAPASNSALTGLANVAGFLDLENGASVSTGSLASSGARYVDYSKGDGGSSLTVDGTLNNSGFLIFGNSSLSSADSVTTSSLVNSNSGLIELIGAAGAQALLDVTAGAAGFGAARTLTGTVQLTGDSAIEFASGQIATIAENGVLQLNGKRAFIEDSTALGSNSALKGLTDVAGALEMYRDVSVTMTGALLDPGSIYLDFPAGTGGSTFSTDGAISDSGTLSIGNSSLSTPSNVTTTALNNSGRIDLTGAGSNQALLDVTTGGAGFGTAGTVTGTVLLTQDSAIEFLNGQISTIGAGSELFLDGDNAFIEDSTALGSNSALTGLTSIEGSLYIENGASMSTGALTNSGVLGVDDFPRDGGSTLSIATGLTNTGTQDIGNDGLSSSDSVAAKSFVNSGTVALTGDGTNFAALDVSGATTNNGAVSITSDTATLAGAVHGAGSFSLSTADLLIDSSVSAGQTIMETGADALTLKHAQDFAGTISGFGTGDTIDATNFVETGTTYNFVENSAGAGGTLTLHDGSLTANILMTGDYSKSNFTLAPDSGTGTLVKFV